MKTTDELKETVIELLKENQTIAFRIKEIASLIRVSKHHYDELTKVIFDLAAQNIVVAQGRRYKWNNKLNKQNHHQALEEKENTTASKIVTGTFDATSLAKNNTFGFVITPDFDIFISIEDTQDAFHNDEVQVELSRKKGNYYYGKILQVTKRARTTFVGDVVDYNNKYLFVCDNPKIYQTFEINNPQIEHVGKKVVLEVKQWGNRVLNIRPSGEITEILGDAGNPEVEILAVIRNYDLPLDFPQPVLDEALAIEDTIDQIEIQKRLDLRECFTLTIDPASAKDFDDAISLEKNEHGNLVLYVHIADVAHYVKPGSELFKEVLNRGNSYYFPKRVIPMLPEHLSNKICSLRPDEEKLTVSVITEFYPDYTIKHQEVRETIISSNARLTYEEVDELFEKGTSSLSPILIQKLNLMRSLSRALSSSRKVRGYLFFDLPEVFFNYNDEGYLQELDLSKETESHSLIENFMLIANEYVSELLTNKTRTTMYRIHEEPELRDTNRIIKLLKAYNIAPPKKSLSLNATYQYLLSSLPTKDYHRVFDKMILRSMKKAKYSIKHLVHFGLGISTYTHFTSPIRRLCDLIVALQLKYAVFNRKIQPFPMQIIDQYALIASQKEVIADNSERDVERKTIIRYMREKVGQEYTGIVINIVNNGLIIALDKEPVTGLLAFNQLPQDYYVLNEEKMETFGKRNGIRFRLMDKVKVQISSVTDDILFSYIDSSNKTQINKGNKEKRIYKKRR